MQAGEMLPQLERHEIQVLSKAGFSVEVTATEAGAAVGVVRRARSRVVTHVGEERDW